MQYRGGQYDGGGYNGQSYEYYQQQAQPIQDQYRHRTQSYEPYHQQPQPIQDQYRGQQSYAYYHQQPQPPSYEPYHWQPQPTQDHHRNRRAQSYEPYHWQPQPIQDRYRERTQSFESYPSQQQLQQNQFQYSGQQQQYVSTPYVENVPFPQSSSSYAAPAVLQPAPPRQPVHRPPRRRTPHPGSGANVRRRRASFSGEKPLRSAMNPDHVFMSMNPPNGLELSNLASKSTVDKLREQIFLIWPSGVAHQERYGYDWYVKFVGNPWDSKGPESFIAQRVICRIFWVLAAQGYVYLTSINTGRAFKSPRLVFIRAPPDARTYFFAMSLNKAGNHVTFVDPPMAVVHSLALSLRTAFPHQIANDDTVEDGVFRIVLKHGIDALGTDENLFLAHILKYFNDMAFKLDASVPLARQGLFGMSGRKEIWVFKGSESWWTSRK